MALAANLTPAEEAFVTAKRKSLGLKPLPGTAPLAPVSPSMAPAVPAAAPTPLKTLTPPGPTKPGYGAPAAPAAAAPLPPPPAQTPGPAPVPLPVSPAGTIALGDLPGAAPTELPGAAGPTADTGSLLAAKMRRVGDAGAGGSPVPAVPGTGTTPTPLTGMDTVPGGVQPVLQAAPPPGPQDLSTVAPAEGPLSTFSATDNLRATQINPTASGRLEDIAAQRDTARNALASSPSRYDIALQTLQNLDSATADARARGIRDIGQSAAKFGRLGSGVVTTDLGSLEERLALARENSLRQLSADAAAGNIQDRLNTLSALGGEEGSVAGQESGQRAELRGERGYQADTAAQALANRIAQQEQEYQQGQGTEAQNLARAGLLLNAGYSGGPENTLLGGADQYGNAAQGALGAMEDYLMTGAALPRTGTGTPYSAAKAAGAPVAPRGPIGPYSGTNLPGVAAPTLGTLPGAGIAPVATPRVGTVTTPIGMPGYTPGLSIRRVTSAPRANAL